MAASAWARLSLRSRLVLVVLLLLALALTFTGVTARTVLNQYLGSRVDQEMVKAVDSLRGGPLAGPLRGPRPRQQLPSRYVVRVLGPEGDTVAELLDPVGSGELPDLTGITPAVSADRAGTPYTVHSGDGTPWRVLLTPLGSDQTLVLATSLADVVATTARLGRIVLAVDLAVLLLGVLVALAAVRGSLRPLSRIEETAGAIAGGDLSRRVPEEGGPDTEVGRLSRALNGMLSQIESAFAVRRASEDRMRRFMADASHELRTPLTSIRGFAELYRQGAVRGPEELDRLMGRIEDESTRMAGLVEDLLLLARVDEERPLRRELVDLLVLAADASHDARATAGGHHVRLEGPDGDGVDGGVTVRGDEERLRQVLMNLVVNAQRHTPPGTTITIRAHRSRGWGVLEVADDGPGLPPQMAGSVFDGFSRADPARGRSAGGGSGLGLTIVAALVRAHGGEVEVDSVPGGGATFRVRVPLATGA